MEKDLMEEFVEEEKKNGGPGELIIENSADSAYLLDLSRQLLCD